MEDITYDTLLKVLDSNPQYMDLLYRGCVVHDSESLDRRGNPVREDAFSQRDITQKCDLLEKH